MSVSMCDNSTRQWCCRIGLVLTVSSVLMMMMFQIWSYYFSLVRDMDDLSILGPSVGAIISVCNETIDKKWNIECDTTPDYFLCNYESTHSDSLIFIDTNCAQTNWYEIPLSACCRTILWILPW